MSLFRKKKKKHISKKVNNVLVFLLVFIIFLLVFGGICLWAVVKINEERRSAQSPESISGTESVRFDESDVRNLLIITVDDRQAQGFVLVHANPAKTLVRTLAIPRDTVVDYKTSEVRLYELVDQQGIAVARDALAKLFDIKFDNYIEISYDNIEKLVDYFESGITMKLDEDLEYHSNQLSVSISGGLRTLSPSQAVKVLRYPAWHGGRKQRADIQAEMTAALVNQYMHSSRKESSDADFSFLVNLASKTDILVSHYTSAKAGLSHLAEHNDQDLCKAISLPGEYQGSSEAIRYYAAGDIHQLLKTALG